MRPTVITPPRNQGLKSSPPGLMMKSTPTKPINNATTRWVLTFSRNSRAPANVTATGSSCITAVNPAMGTFVSVIR